MWDGKTSSIVGILAENQCKVIPCQTNKGQIDYECLGFKCLRFLGFARTECVKFERSIRYGNVRYFWRSLFACLIIVEHFEK